MMVFDNLAELKSKHDNQELMIETLMSRLSTLRAELIKSKKNYNYLYDLNSSVYFTINKHYCIQAANFQASYLLGLDRIQLYTKPFLNFITASSQGTFISSINKLYDTKCKQACDIELLQKGGSKRAATLESMLIEDNLIRLCVLDITNQRININQKLQLEERFNLTNHLFQHSSDAIAALDSMLNITIFNRSFSELFSIIFSTKIIAGMSLMMALTDFPNLKTKIANACKDALLGNKTYVIIENHRNKNEIYHCYEICISSSNNPLNQKNEMLLQIKNLTEWKLQERQWVMQQAAIAQSNKISTLSEMTSTLAHEINQPLTAIIAYSRSCLFMINNKLGYKEICADLLAPLEQIALQSEHAGAIIHTIKNFMREGNFYPEETNVNILIKETLLILNCEILDLKFKITLNLMDDLPPTMINKTYIMQVILNLAQNSIDALKDDCGENPELRIETSLLADYIHVHVRDNGPGIPSEIKNKILNHYFTTKPRGTGLGLRICRRLIEEHGGKLILQDHAEKGAWFTFTLPIKLTSQNKHV